MKYIWSLRGNRRYNDRRIARRPIHVFVIVDPFLVCFSTFNSVVWHPRKSRFRSDMGRFEGYRVTLHGPPIKKPTRNSLLPPNSEYKTR